MIILLNASDSLALSVSNIYDSPGAASYVTWYCSYKTNISPGAGIANGFINPPVNLSQSPPNILSGPAAGNYYQVTEITITHSITLPAPAIAGNIPPAAISILYHNGNSNSPGFGYAQLYSCLLEAGYTLSYNPTPGLKGSWVKYDGNGKKVAG